MELTSGQQEERQQESRRLAHAGVARLLDGPRSDERRVARAHAPSSLTPLVERQSCSLPVVGNQGVKVTWEVAQVVVTLVSLRSSLGHSLMLPRSFHTHTGVASHESQPVIVLSLLSFY